MKTLISIFAIMITATSALKAQQEVTTPIIELVKWKPADGLSLEDAKEAILVLNAFVGVQPGFISRRTAVSKNGEFIDIVMWTSLEDASNASAKAQQSEECMKAFSSISEESMFIEHFEQFNHLEK